MKKQEAGRDTGPDANKIDEEMMVTKKEPIILGKTALLRIFGSQRRVPQGSSLCMLGVPGSKLRHDRLPAIEASRHKPARRGGPQKNGSSAKSHAGKSAAMSRCQSEPIPPLKEPNRSSSKYTFSITPKSFKRGGSPSNSAYHLFLFNFSRRIDCRLIRNYVKESLKK